ncbi:uncharacterized protein SCHCODRAFT_02702952 [Schizophyllum commune H4-8]|nr:uncharacterized protein SCHCODRAFT_02702952 [Schizophyllum commune H4-8]KAI5890373.1 hypothetical protein SCHCODRAFT_02702952 [Schizophyllum commune H4-8]
MSNYVTLDDRALNVTYSGDWNKMGTASQYDSTTSAPRNDNSSFEVHFYGHKINVRGTRNERSGGVQFAFSIDEGPSALVTLEAIKPGYVLYDDELWSSDVLGDTDEMHVLTGQAINASAGVREAGTAEVFLDSFRVYQVGRAPDEQSTTSVSAWSSASTGTTSTLPFSMTPPSLSASPTSTQLANSASDSSGNGRIGAIVGGTFGGAALLLFALGLLLWHRRRRSGHAIVEPLYVDPRSPSPMAETTGVLEPPLYGITHNPKLRYESSTNSLNSSGTWPSTIQRKERMVQPSEETLSPRKR